MALTHDEAPRQETALHLGRQLRYWREDRRLSQLELATLAGVSARHLSFLETGRSRASRDMVLRLADELAVPLRERNPLLVAAGYAPTYTETPLIAAPLAPVRAAIRQMLGGHDPYPALVVDAAWNVVEANAGFALFTEAADEDLLRAPVNALRLALHPRGMASRILNLDQWRAHVLSGLRRRAAADSRLDGLLAELQGYAPGDAGAVLEESGSGDIFVPLHFRHHEHELAFFAVFSTFGGARDITVAELVIESFFPADERTAQLLRARSESALAGGRGSLAG